MQSNGMHTRSLATGSDVEWDAMDGVVRVVRSRASQRLRVWGLGFIVHGSTQDAVLEGSANLVRQL